MVEDGHEVADGATPGLKEVMDIRDIEAIKVMADERRLAILRLLKQPRTVKALAEELGTPATKLYYHVHLLEQHGLIRATRARMVKGIVEKHYQVSARHFRMRNPMLAGDALSGDQTAVLFADLLERTRDELVTALRLGLGSGAVPGSDLGSGTGPASRQGPPRHPFVTRKHVDLTQAQLKQLHTRLDQLVRDIDAFNAENEGLSEDELRPFALTLALHLRPEEDET